MKFLSSVLFVGTMAMDSTMLMLMMSQNGNQNQQSQMSNLLPLLLMDKSESSGSSENTDLLMIMMMQGNNMYDTNSMLPLLMLGDDGLDFKSLFLYTNMLNQDCTRSSDDQMNMLIPMLLLDDKSTSTTATTESTSSNLMMLMMMQSMGNQPVGMSNMLPLLMMDDIDDDSSLLLMMMMNSMTGGMNTQQGFDNNFNMMLPLLLRDDCEKTFAADTLAAGADALAVKAASDAKIVCEKKQKDLLVMMMAMQSMAPNTQMGPNMMLPLLLMDDSSDNENLMFYMMMSQNTPSCIEPEVYVPASVFVPARAPVFVPEPKEETVFRTWRVSEDGTKTLISSETNTV